LKVGLYDDIVPAEDDEAHHWRLLALDKDTDRVLWDWLGREGIPRGKRHPKSTHCNSTPRNRRTAQRGHFRLGGTILL
jgi:hypothetical protein